MRCNVLILLSALFSSALIAGEEITNNPKRERSTSEAMTEVIYKRFEKLQEMIADGKNNEARSGLLALQKRRINDFEVAQINQFLGFVEAAEEKYDLAVKYFQKAIDANALTDRAHFGMMLQKAQLLIASGKYQEGIKALQDYYKVTDKIKDNVFALEANAYAQLNKPRKAIPLLKKAISLADKPNEQWNYLLYSLHMQLSQFNEAAKVLEYLIVINPEKKDYFKRLSSVYFALKKDKKALAVLVLADKKGMLADEKERLQLFKMYAFLGIPFKAGQVLEKGLKDGVVKPSFKHWDDLGKIWYTASEMDKSLSAYDEASKLASDGKIDIQRAYIYFDRDNWAKAKQALNAALEKGGISEKQTGNAWMLLGMCESEMGNANAALKALNQGSKYPNTRKSSLQWIEHIKESQKRKKAIEEAKRINEAVEEV